MAYDTSSMKELKAKATDLLKKYHLTPDAVHFGQHFLIEPGTIDLFVKTCNASKTNTVLEIGPGLGFITKALLRKGVKLTTVEVDERLKPILKDIQKEFPPLRFIIQNVLQYDSFHFDTICGALSYNIFEPLIRKLFRNNDFQQGVFIVSNKFVEDYKEHSSILSLLLEAFFTVEFVRELPPDFFYPKPRTGGAMIKITRSKTGDKYHFLLRELFIQGDKKVKNALREGLIAYNQSVGQKLTKKEARTTIQSLIRSQESNEVIFQCSKKFLGKLDLFLRSLS